MGVFNANLNNLYFGAGNIITAGMGVMIKDVPFELSDWSKLKYMILAGLCGVAVQLTIVQSLKYEKATTISVIESLIVVYGFVGDILFFGLPIQVTSVIGALLVTGSCLFVSLSKSEPVPPAPDPPLEAISNGNQKV